MRLGRQLVTPGGIGGGARKALSRVADRLMEAHGGARARLQLVRHHLLAPQQVLDGQRIDSEGTYEQLDLIEHRRQRSEEITPGGGP